MKKKHKIQKKLLLWRVLIWLLIFSAIGRSTYIISIKIINYVFNSEAISVPALTGIEYKKAKQILEKYNIKIVKIGEKKHDFYPKDFIISQEPFYGTKIKKGQNINVIVSSGPLLLRIPKLENKNVIEAENLLRNIGFKIAHYCYVYNNDIPKDFIITTTPKPGKLIVRNTPVSLLISKGKKYKKFIVPNLIGLLPEEAQKNAYPFKLVKHYESNQNTEPDKIFRQIPDPYSTLEFGKSINIWINKEIIPVKGKRRYEYISYTIPDKKKNYHLKVIITDELGIREIDNRIVNANEDIEYSISGVGRMKITIFLDNKIVKELYL